MSLILSAPVTPEDATQFVRQVPNPLNNVLNQYLPDKEISASEVSFQTQVKTNRTAKFRSPDGNITDQPRDSVTSRSASLMPLSAKGSYGELERLGMERLRQAGSSLDAVVTAIYDDLTLSTESIRNRVEMARGDLLSDGKVTLQENGLNVEADFQVPAGNFVTPQALWSDTANADVITDLTNWSEAYTALNGFPPGQMILSRKVFGFLQRNAVLRTAAASIVGAPQIVTKSMLAAVLDEFSLPQIGLVYDNSLDVDGTATRVTNEADVIFVPPAGVQLGYTAWGISATALELVDAAEVDMSFSSAPGLTGVIIKDGPPFIQYTFVDSMVLPILSNPNALSVAHVL